MVVILLLCAACSETALKNTGKELEDTLADIKDSDNKYIMMVKNGYREDHPELTYEKAFTAFFATPRWKYFEGDEGQKVIEFTGDCTYRDTDVKARVQFVVDEDKGTVEATYLAFNEVPQDAFTLAALIGTVFESVSDQEATMNKNKSDSEVLLSNEVETENSFHGEVLYNGIPVSQLFELPLDDVVKALGTPLIHDEYKCAYNEIEFGLYSGEISAAESYNPEKFIKDGVTLAKNRTELINLLGNPYSEGDFGSGYEMAFECLNYSLSISIGDYDGTAWKIYAWKHGDDEPSEEEWGGDYAYASAFNRSDYFTGISREDLLRYPDTYSSSKVYFTRYEVAFIYESRYFIAKRSSNSGDLHVVIDARGSSGANPVVGDIVTIYGVSWGITSISWTDGRRVV